MDNKEILLQQILDELRSMNQKLESLSDGGYTIMDIFRKLEDIEMKYSSEENVEKKTEE